ncbi:hypothetical protein BDF20DRAFT_837154 [Mycotypha africana]|uniref:uncharacterized protein n=1 Tax=Mycotypha africana TaxID=64632 RepID=UPI0023019FFB|nr:uncharacterized protein BDF20DRAFT_837154 [Mycotypha africana]KAI8973187.1 hypothetical protein BDF20DRAFT_837154 [Mycotypha africana]
MIPKLKFFTIRRSFLNDLEKLKKNDQLPREIISSLGNMVKEIFSILFKNGFLRKARKGENNDDFWSSWQEHFDKCECHKYCLEKYHIIECGYTIQCKPSYDVDLYEQLGNNKHQVVKSPFMDFGVYTTKFMQELKKGNERSIMKALLDDNHWEEIEAGSNSANARYVYDFFIVINRYMGNCSMIEKSESIFSYHLVWPLLSLAVKTATLPIRNLLFKTGEVILDSSDETLKAVGVVELDGIEFCLLETSDAYGISDNSRFGKDHVKGSFGALMFLRKILKTCFYATEDMLCELKVLFVHARSKRIHLWSLEMPAKDVQVLEHLSYTDIPTNVSQVDKILNLGNFVWKLSDCLRKSYQTINRMKEEHVRYLTMRQLNPNNQSRVNLATLVEKEIQKPLKGSDYGIILPKQIDDFDLDNTVIPANKQ